MNTFYSSHADNRYIKTDFYTLYTDMCMENTPKDY